MIRASDVGRVWRTAERARERCNWTRASWMGPRWLAAAVAGLENVRHAAAVARRVMEKTPHLLLVGEGARLFAVQQGFALENLNTPESVAEWERRGRQKPAARKPTRRKQRAAVARHGGRVGLAMNADDWPVHAARRACRTNCRAAWAIRR